MNALRVLLAAMFITIMVYTTIVMNNHGADLISVFFGDMRAMTWPGQFNTDFMGFLILSGLWLSWRHHFTPAGLVLGLFGLFGGIMFLAPYLLVVSFQANGDIKELMLGKTRANS